MSKRRAKAIEVDKDAIATRLEEPKRKVKKTELKGVKDIYDRKVSFTLELAVRYLEMDPVKYERPIRDSWVEELAAKMANGLFRPEDVNINIAICKWDGKERRLNGQHTCWARLELPASWRPKVQVVKYEVKNEDDYRILYAQKDHIAVRTRGHRDTVVLFDTPEYTGATAETCRYLMQGFAFWYGSWQRLTSEEQGKLLRNKFFNTGRKVAALIALVKELKMTHLHRRQGVYAAMFETVEKLNGQAVDFWEKVIHGLQFKSQRDPAKVLDKYLRDVTVSGGGRKRSVTTVHMYNVCVECFNCWKDGKTLNKTPVGKRDHRSVAR